MKKTNKILVIFLILLLSITASFTYARYYSSYSATISLNIREPKYTISFNANGGSGTMQNQIFSYGTNQNLTANGFTYDGYIFNGWNTSQDGSGTTYLDEESIGNLTTNDNANIPLYAQWSLGGNYHITYTGIPSTGLPTDVTPNAPLSINFGTSKILIQSVTIDGIGVTYTFSNNILEISSATGNVIITGTSWDNEDATHYILTSSSPTNSQNIASGGKMSALASSGFTIGNGDTKTITQIDLTFTYTQIANKGASATVILKFDDGTPDRTVTPDISFAAKSTSTNYSITGLSIAPGHSVEVTYSVSSGSGNQKLEGGVETFTAIYS